MWKDSIHIGDGLKLLQSVLHTILDSRIIPIHCRGLWSKLVVCSHTFVSQTVFFLAMIKVCSQLVKYSGWEMPHSSKFNCMQPFLRGWTYQSSAGLCATWCVLNPEHLAIFSVVRSIIRVILRSILEGKGYCNRLVTKLVYLSPVLLVVAKGTIKWWLSGKSLSKDGIWFICISRQLGFLASCSVSICQFLCLPHQTFFHWFFF